MLPGKWSRDSLFEICACCCMVNVDKDQFATFWNVCKTVRLVKLYWIKILTAPELIEERLDALPDLQRVHMRHKYACRLLRLCSGMQSFSLDNLFASSDAFLQELAQPLEGRHFWRFDILEVTDADDNKLTRAMEQVKELSFERSGIGDQSIAALELHLHI
ncbi:hypothetical protein BGZ59_010346 [Podila verticillata]|nr:hypothetical protein BGZ59_010346 [Podila verticillata]